MVMQMWLALGASWHHIVGTLGTSGRPSVNKRNREQARKERAKEKAQQRSERSAERQVRTPALPGEDPDIAHIIPGPQPTND